MRRQFASAHNYARQQCLLQVLKSALFLTNTFRIIRVILIANKGSYVKRSTSLLAAMALAAAQLSGLPAANAQSLKFKEMISRDKEKVASLGKEANQACGTQIAFQVDYTTYSRVLDDDNNQSPWAYLANATDALKKVCRSDEGKQAVQAKVKSVIVSNGDAESESLANGVLRYQVPYRGHSPASVVNWLQANL